MPFHKEKISTVIPAKAGIQSIQQSPRSGTSTIGFVCYAEMI